MVCLDRGRGAGAALEKKRGRRNLPHKAHEDKWSKGNANFGVSLPIKALSGRRPPGSARGPTKLSPAGDRAGSLTLFRLKIRRLAWQDSGPARQAATSMMLIS